MSGQKKAIGLIVNPMAGRDIRRLVAHASLQSQPEKALVAHRILAGVAAVPDIEVLLPEDRSGFFAWLQGELGLDVPVRLVHRPRTTMDDTTPLWVEMLVNAGADALIVVGGDGTQRNVAQAAPAVPVLPVAGGTNNVACYLGDQTAGGYATARFLKDGLTLSQAASRAKLLHLSLPDGGEELALIDVALTRQNYTGAMAIWDPDDVETLVLAVADPIRPGLSNVAGYQTPVSFADDFGLYVRLGDDGTDVPSVLAPGLMATFRIHQERRLAFDEPIVLTRGDRGGSLALDGERTVVLAPGRSVTVTLHRDGPWILDPAKILAHLNGRI